jgi:hypothetical protein
MYQAATSLVARRGYHENIVEHYENPRNVGSLDKNDGNVGTVRDFVVAFPVMETYVRMVGRLLRVACLMVKGVSFIVQHTSPHVSVLTSDA